MQRLSLRLSVHIRPAHEHEQRSAPGGTQEPVTACLWPLHVLPARRPPPKIKQIIITDSNHPNRGGGEENMRRSSHVEYKVLC